LQGIITNNMATYYHNNHRQVLSCILPVRHIIILLLMALVSISAHAQNQNYFVTSPDGKTQVTINSKRYKIIGQYITSPPVMVMSVRIGGKKVVTEKEVGINIKASGHMIRFGRTEVDSVTRHSNLVDTSTDYEPGLQDLKGRYNQIEITKGKYTTLEVRVYNSGIAYRFHISGIADDYKILDMTRVFPHDIQLANYGTIIGDITLPWRSMTTDQALYYAENGEKAVIEDDPYRSVRQVIPWRDALSSVSVGATANWYNGGCWKYVGMDWGVAVDYTYKKLYTGFAVTPSYVIMEIPRDRSWYPFEGVAGRIKAWSLTAKLGYSLPVQVGLETFNFQPI